MENNQILKLRLYENGVDFINKSMESFIRSQSQDERLEIKYALLLLANGYELILKSIIEDVHPLLIVKNLDNNTDVTVDAENLIKRIHLVHANANTNKFVHKKDERIFTSIRNIRNKIIHKEAVFDDFEKVSDLYAKTLFSLDRVTKQFKNVTLAKTVENWSNVVSIDKIKMAYFSNEQGLKIGDTGVPCSICLLEKLVNKGDKVKCLNCGQVYLSILDAIKAIDDIEQKNLLIDLFKNDSAHDFFECPDCYEEGAFVDEEHKKLDCVYCNVSLEVCNHCGYEAMRVSAIDYGEYLPFKDKKSYGITDWSFYCYICRNSKGDKCSCCGDDSSFTNIFHLDIINYSKFHEELSILNKKYEGPYLILEACPDCQFTIHELEEEGYLRFV